MRRIVTVIAACALLFAACGGGDDEPEAGGGQDEAQTETTQAQEEAAATIEVASASMGDIVVDSEGNTLYMFVPDQEKNGKPTCYEDCAEAWPALEAQGELVAGDGLDQSLLESVERTDGTSQVAYNDLPLYYFSGDEAAGDTNGQGLMDVWYVVSPEGEPVDQT
jgi:predicted lipoprotein with Yx(FWY)xxD motif